MAIHVINSDKDLTSFGNKLKITLRGIPKWKVIAVDGPMQSGKTTVVTKFLSGLLNAEIINIDSLIKIDTKCIIYKKSSLGLDSGKRYIVDGILNRKFLKKFGLIANINIYVKKMANYGWVERNWLDKEIIKDYGLDEGFKANNIDRQIYKYHNRYRPVENADEVLEIAESYVDKVVNS